jgi:hypothetical protein
MTVDFDVTKLSQGELEATLRLIAAIHYRAESGLGLGGKPLPNAVGLLQAFGDCVARHLEALEAEWQAAGRPSAKKLNGKEKSYVK